MIESDTRFEIAFPQRAEEELLLWQPAVTRDRARFAAHAFAVVRAVSGEDVHADTILQTDLGWDSEVIKALGAAIQARLRYLGCHFRSVPEGEYERCEILDDFVDLLWRHIAHEHQQREAG